MIDIHCNRTFRGFAETSEPDGMEKGMEKEALAIARRMLAKKKDIAEIVEFTGLSEAQVTSLK